MSDQTWRQNGPFTGFQYPVELPGAAWDSSADWSLCFSDAWLPYIIGAFNVLQRRETWKGTDADVYETVQQARAMQDGFVAGCGAGLGTFQDCTFELAASPGPFQIVAPSAGRPSSGEYIPDIGWVVSTYDNGAGSFSCWQVLRIALPFPDGANLHSVTVTGNLEFPLGDGVINVYYWSLGASTLYGATSGLGSGVFSETYSGEVIGIAALIFTIEIINTPSACPDDPLSYFDSITVAFTSRDVYCT